MRRTAIAGLVLLGLVACAGGSPHVWPSAKDLNRHRRREVLCASRSGGGRTGVATFSSHRSTLHSADLQRHTAQFVGCDFHASNGTLTIVVGPHFTVVGSDDPDGVARVLETEEARDAFRHETESRR